MAVVSGKFSASRVPYAAPQVFIIAGHNGSAQPQTGAARSRVSQAHKRWPCGTSASTAAPVRPSTHRPTRDFNEMIIVACITARQGGTSLRQAPHMTTCLRGSMCQAFNCPNAGSRYPGNLSPRMNSKNYVGQCGASFPFPVVPCGRGERSTGGAGPRQPRAGQPASARLKHGNQGGSRRACPAARVSVYGDPGVTVGAWPDGRLSSRCDDYRQNRPFRS